ncbi:zinc finger and BTB domain-containing protein 25 isoform X2 [Cynoglossus semilaevis]|uniref:zinc finger and BTB domain-containing protein 25 isoform X2 n=1 Tax=Cynoglossus semilaevis TaxID=244447 RepID=UPI0007DC941C|nr:zinc finger and BTB domain-containing protein 25 isoform X2 [Cynoglossus semilaevis]
MFFKAASADRHWHFSRHVTCFLALAELDSYARAALQIPYETRALSHLHHRTRTRARTWRLHVFAQLNVQREFGFLCDCTVAIGNVYFKAHRAVLAAFSNYFKMIFIHQSSECIKIQPTDIQPDVFSYLLHIMYTGMCPKQPVDQRRLQDGVKFLHAYKLCHQTDEVTTDLSAEGVRMSNLYGIQISSQLARKEASRVPKTTTSSTCGGHANLQLSPNGGLEGVRLEHQEALPNVCSVASGEDSDVLTRIKLEQVEEEEEQEEGAKNIEEERSVSPTQDHSPKLQFRELPLALLCPRCGQRCSSPDGLRDHLFGHAFDPALQIEELSQSGAQEGSFRGQEQLDAGHLEEALRQSRALADQLAAELRRSRGGGGGGRGSPTPGVPHSRKRKIACAVCSLRFSHKSQLQEHMYTHTGKPRIHRYNRFCSQLFSGPAHLCEGAVEHGPGPGLGLGASITSAAAAVLPEGVNSKDNGSPPDSLDSEVSQGSVDGLHVE